MELQISETTFISPSSPPFHNDHILPLSHLDTDPNLHLTFSYLRAYAAAGRTGDPFAVISAALSEALVYYYPFTGTLRPCGNDRRLELFCSADGSDGVPLVLATANCTLGSVDYLEHPGAEYMRMLAPAIGLMSKKNIWVNKKSSSSVGSRYPDPDPDLVSPLALQLTVFACGGFCLGASVHHSLCDGLGATQFFTAVAELARGATRISVSPVWDRAELLGPRDPPRVGAPGLHEVFELDEGLEPYGQKSTGPVRRECFEVGEECLNRFKGVLLEHSGMKFTTFEALGAFIWRARVKYSGLPDHKKVKFAYPINMRNLLNPSLPKGYWGNACVPMYVDLTAHCLVTQPLWETARLINQTKVNATDEYVRSFIDFQALNSGKGITAGDAVSAFTDWRHLGHSAVDFGWGPPVAVVPVSRRLIGSVEPCFFLPHSRKREKEGFRVLVWVKETAAEGFKMEMERFCREEFGGM